MSNLEELIERLCPDGVEYKTLGELGKFYGGLTGKSKEDFKEGNAKFITYKNVYSNPALDLDVEDRVRIYPDENQRILEYGDVIFTGSSETPDECGLASVLTKKTDEKLYLNSFCFVFRFNDVSVMLPDFSKHLFRSNFLRYQIGKTASGVTRFNVSKKLMAKVKLPVPPLEVQREIVRILDNFTFLTAELAAELAARQKQYEYYRDLLLTFKPNESTILNERTNELELNAPVRWMKLGDIADIKRGIRVVKKQLITEGKYPVYQNSLEPMGYFNKYNCEAETTYVISAGAAGEIGFCNKKFWAADDCLIFTDTKNVNNKFIYYSLLVRKNILLANVRKASIPRLSRIVVENLIIPVPSLEVQQRIVGILDRFDTLCNDISSGLPAEIEARQKQYEYYRDKLLTFKEFKKEA